MSFIDPALYQLDPETAAALASERRNAYTQYGQQSATTAYQRALAQQNEASSVGNMARQWNNQREKLPGTFAGRGLLNSGIYGNALQKYGTERTAAFDQNAERYQQQLGQFDLTGIQSAQNYQTTLANLADQDQAKRIAIANQLRELQ